MNINLSKKKSYLELFLSFKPWSCISIWSTNVNYLRQFVKQLITTDEFTSRLKINFILPHFGGIEGFIVKNC